jgi:hypothetical protein
MQMRERPKPGRASTSSAHEGPAAADADVRWWSRAAPAPVPPHFLLDRLWSRYVEEVPHAATFARLAARGGARFENDHIALRSLARPGSGIAMFARVFERLGWKAAGSYELPDVHLRAVHLARPGMPRVFLSELDLTALPADVRDVLLELPADRPPPDDDDELASWFAAPAGYAPAAADLDLVGRVSHYGAWLLCFGRKVNHFTAAVDDVNAWQRRLLDAGVAMKADIEGAPGAPLRQTATQACLVDVALKDGSRRAVPYAYFELASRAPGFDGFIAPQARQLFEMTAPAEAAARGEVRSQATGIEGRRHPRRGVTLHVELAYGGVRIPVSTENLSLGGLFLQLPDDVTPEPHAVLEMTIELPPGDVRATGTVIYRVAGRGVGVEFTWWDDEADPARQRLAAFLSSLEA